MNGKEQAGQGRQAEPNRFIRLAGCPQDIREAASRSMVVHRGLEAGLFPEDIICLLVLENEKLMYRMADCIAVTMQETAKQTVAALAANFESKGSG